MKLAILALVALCGAPGCSEQTFLTSNGTVDEGNAALAAGQLEQAKAAYDRAAANIPESPELNYDRGLAASAAGEHEEAHQLLVRALDTRDLGLERLINAAMGTNYARWALALERATPADPEDPTAESPAMEKWQLAVQHLETALVADPTDAPSRRTLEVALLRVDPPCSSRDDAREDNDTAQAASLIEVAAPEAAPQSGGAPPPSPEGAGKDRLEWQEQLFSCPEDPDWFAIQLDAGDRVSVKMTVPDEGGTLTIGSLIRQEGAGGADLTKALATGEGPLHEVELTIDDNAAGRYLLRVDNVDQDEVSYSLEVSVRPSCRKTEDRFEENDVVGMAPVLTPGPLPDLKICPDDADWYAVDLAEGESLFVFAGVQPNEDEDEEDTPAPEEGAPPEPPPIQLTLADGLGQTLGVGAPAGQGRISTLLTPGPGRYFFKVVGEPEVEARYQLEVRVVPPCPEGDDAMEDNDLVEDAVDLMAAMGQAGHQQPGGAPGVAEQQPGAGGGPQTMFARICAGDEDWFTLTPQDEQPLMISAIFEHAKGDLALELYDASGRTLEQTSDSSTAESNGEGLAIAPPEEGEEVVAKALRVRGVDGAENFYLLRLEQPQPQSGGGDDSQDPSEDENEDENEDPNDDKSEDEKPPEPEPQEAQPLEEALDKLDRNPENLEAENSARRSPLATHRPRKDW